MKVFITLLVVISSLMCLQVIATAEITGIPVTPKTVTLTAEKMDTQNHYIRLTFENKSNRAVSLDRTLHVFRRDGDNWVNIPSYAPIGKEAVIEVLPGNTYTRLMDIRQYCVDDPDVIYGRVDAGEYRVVMRADNINVSAQYQIPVRFWPGSSYISWADSPVYDRNTPEITYHIRSLYDSPVTYKPAALYRLEERPDRLDNEIPLWYPLPDQQPMVLSPGETVSGIFHLARIYRQPLDSGRYAIRFELFREDSSIASSIYVQFDIEILNPHSEPKQIHPAYTSCEKILDVLKDIPQLENVEFVWNAPVTKLENTDNKELFRLGNVGYYSAEIPDVGRFEIRTFPNAEAADRYLGVTFRHEPYEMADGMVTSVITEWTVTPHPYLFGRFTITYFGNDGAILDALDQLFGYPTVVR